MFAPIFIQLAYFSLLVNADEIGQICYFIGGCPQGWTFVVEAQGRVILGSGTGVDINGKSKYFKDGEIGGEFLHIQTEEELADHKHQTPIIGLINPGQDLGGGTQQSTGFFSPGTIPQRVNSNVSNAGKSKPSNIIQPYISFQICKKTHESSSEIAQQKIINQLSNQIVELNKKLETLENYNLNSKKNVILLDQTNDISIAGVAIGAASAFISLILCVHQLFCQKISVSPK